jgi:hypothetical protein
MLNRSEELGNFTSSRSYDNLSGGSTHGGSSGIGSGSGIIIIQGTLAKKGRGSIYFPWSSRFVTLDDNGYLRYYTRAPQNLSYQTVSEQDTNLRGIVDIRGCTVRILSSGKRNKHPFSFILERLPSRYATQSSTLTLAANSEPEMQGWVSLIKALVAKLADQADDNSKYRYETLNNLLGKSGAGSSMAGPTGMHTSSTIAEFRQLKEMRRQQQRQREAAHLEDAEPEAEPAVAASLAISRDSASHHNSGALRIDDSGDSSEGD